MNISNRFFVRLSFSIGLLSVSIISYQLLLIQILSIVQWYHFAYMIISIAMLGFGTAGTIIALFRNYFIKRSDALLPFFIITSSLLMVLAIAISQTDLIRFDSYLLFVDYGHIPKLMLTYLVFMLPFLFGALSIGLVFVKYVDKIGTLYFANMIGSGIGGIITIFLMWNFFPGQLLSVIALISLIAGLILIPKKQIIFFSIFTLITLSSIIYFYLNPFTLKVSEYKSISRTVNLPETEIVTRESSPYGLLEIVNTPYLRYAPGLSLKYPGVISVNNAAFNNGDWLGPLISSGNDSLNPVEYSTEMLPYVINKNKNALILGSGTGRQITTALLNNIKTITAVESNRALIGLLTNVFQNEVDSVYTNSSVKVDNSSSRTYILSSQEKYDLITLPIIDAFGGTSGMFSLQEQYLLTVESFSDMWDRLNDSGTITITTWIDYPFRNPLKIIATLSEMLGRQNINEPEQHIAAIKNWNTITISIKKSPITQKEIESVRMFCTEMNFDPIILPGIHQDERERFNQFQDGSLYVLLDRILSSQEEREKVYNEYPFNIRPATDNQPYYSQFLMWKSIPLLAELFGDQSVAFFEVGYLILYITFAQIVLLALLLIVVPLFKLGFKGGNKVRTLFYFSGLGIGYMFIEIILIQRFTLYFGNVIYAAAAVVCLMLVSSGIGSFVSQRIKIQSKYFIVIISVIIFSLLIYTIFLSDILKMTIGSGLSIKIVISALIIAPTAFFMGMPFPLGLRLLSSNSETLAHIPWAWGINGMFSVVATVLVTIVAIELGFVWVMIFAIAAYSLSLLTKLRY